MDCLLCRNCCANQNNNDKNEMIIDNSEERINAEEEKSIFSNKNEEKKHNIANNDRKNSAINNEMLSENNNGNEITNKEHNASEEQNKCQICASAIDKYPSILKRMSNVELYYLCENFLERDKYNNKKRTLQETADKLISFAKGECIDVDDIHLLEQINDDDLEKCVNNKRDDIKLLGEGADNAIYSCKKKKF